MTVVDSIIDVFEMVAGWIPSALSELVGIFYDTTAASGGELTFFGALSVVGVAISIFFLLVGLIQNFLHLRG